MIRKTCSIALGLFLSSGGGAGLPLRAQGAPALPSAPKPTSLAVQLVQLPTSRPYAKPGDTASVHITLEEAIRRAETNEPAFAAAAAAARVAQFDRGITRNTLLPNALYHNQYQYTQPSGATTTAFGGTQPLPRFIANDSVHEYYSQAFVNETLSLRQTADLKLATATAARAAAEEEVAQRGLVSTVVGLFYGDLAAAHKLDFARRALSEAAAFTSLTRQRELGREGAHADVVKAQLLEQQRTRDLGDAILAEERARLELAVLLFADPHMPYTLDPAAAPPLPSRAEVQAAASANNPDLRAAIAALHEGDAEVLRARAAYLPDLALNLTYGINSPQFAVHGYLVEGSDTLHLQNLGYSAAVTLDIPVWDWLSTDKRVKQGEIRRQANQIALSAAQKRLVVALDEFYNEAQTTAAQAASLLESVATAEESLRLTKLRYSAGEASVLEVVDAQTALTSAENASADGQLRYWSALANLQTLTGTL